MVFAKAAAKDIAKHAREIKEVEADLESYGQEEQLAKENRRLVLDEIKRKDREFYDQWCNDED